MSDIVLRDGSTITVRPIGPGDEEAMLVFLRRALGNVACAALLLGRDRPDAQARHAVDVDGENAYGLIAISGPDGGIVGHAGYGARTRRQRRGRVRRSPTAVQGRGLATTLLGHLAAHAHDHGITTFTAIVLPENHRMIEVFRDSGFPVEVQSGARRRLRAAADSAGRRRAGALRGTGRQTASVAAVRSVLAPRRSP